MRSKIQQRQRGRQSKEQQQQRLPQGKRPKRLPKGHRQSRSLAVLFLLLLVWSICLGWGLSLIGGATVKPAIVAQSTPAESGTVEELPARYKLGRELYVENCASCHVALPPEVLPSETWRRLLLEPEQHYGQQLKPFIGPTLLVMWEYLKTYSRPQAQKEQLPYRVSESRFFKALHPRVKFTEKVSLGSCVSCHPGAAQSNYRTLTPEWENSP